ncbi:MAG: heme exporter protein CcmD [Alphaproteobacteria bacterium]|nr:heme exporter protein CcmD [Alphaproteobacteria bacterium]
MQAADAWWSLEGYGIYIWPAYVCAAVLLAGLGLDSRRRLKAAKALLEEAGGRSTPEQ